MSNRDKVGVRVPQDIKDSYESQIREKYGFKRPYAGMVLEKELKVNLGMGDESALYNSLRDLVDISRAKKQNIESRDFSGGEALVQYRIHPDVRAKLEELSYETFGSMGSMVAKIMYGYALGEGFENEMLECVQELEKDDRNEDLSATERREKAIAEYLKENHTKENHPEDPVVFELEDFDKAAKKAGVSTKEYAREKYLKPVLDRLEVNPTEERFTPLSSGSDPRNLPYEAMTNDEAKTAIKAEALQNSRSGGFQNTVEYITISDAAGVLGTSNRVAKRLMKEIHDPEVGFTYREDTGLSDEPFLEVTQSRAKEYNVDNKEALELAGLLEQDDPEESEPEGEEFQETSETQSKPAGVVAD